MKYIRECRMGQPKTFKTGAVVGTYPKPMLVFQFDGGGTDIVPSKAVINEPSYFQQNPGHTRMDIAYEDIVFVRPGEMNAVMKKPEQPQVTVIDYTLSTPVLLSSLPASVPSTLAFDQFQGQSGDYNLMASCISQGFPWRTVVFDSMTGYMEIVKSWLASFNPAGMSDARYWAFQTGEKVRQLVLSAAHLPAHMVCIFHTLPPEADEETKILQELPNVYSKLKGNIGGLFSQYVYTTKGSGGLPVVKTADYLYVKGIGNRFPAGLPAEVKPDFLSIYGKELSK